MFETILEILFDFFPVIIIPLYGFVIILLFRSFNYITYIGNRVDTYKDLKEKYENLLNDKTDRVLENISKKIIASGAFRDNRIKFSCFFTHKDGENLNDYKDAFAYSVSSENNEASLKIGLSDGATVSAFSKNWSDLLVRKYIKSNISDINGFKNIFNELNEIQQKYINTSRENQWWLQDAFIVSAATFLGFEINSSIRNNGINYWNSFSVGDTCLFQFRQNKLLQSFPMVNEEKFNNKPDLLTNNRDYNEKNDIWNKSKEIKGKWEKDDTFVLATDGFAKWLLGKIKHNEKCFEDIPGFKEINFRYKETENWIRNKQSSGEMQNDDITIILIQIN
jgi:hypothetical protein